LRVGLRHCKDNRVTDLNLDAGHMIGALSGAIEERVKRGRAEVSAQHISGEPTFGAWGARSTGTVGPARGEETAAWGRWRVPWRGLPRAGSRPVQDVALRLREQAM
jgi:hypothetical protein